MARSKTLFGAAMTVLTFAPLCAAAQTPAGDDPDHSAVEDVMVTAQRREERLVDVPITITSISPMELQAQNIRTLKDLFRATTALTITNNGSKTTPSIRGVHGRVVKSSVALYVDGVYNSSEWALGADFGNVARIDILKGPQGTLFGRNATGGAILVTTADPSHAPSLRVSAGVEERNGRSTSIYATTGLTDTLAMDVSLSFRESDGWIKKGLDPQGNVGAPVGTPMNSQWHEQERVKLLWTPNDEFRLTLSAEHGGTYDPTGYGRTWLKYHRFPPLPPVERNTVYLSVAPDARAYWATGYVKGEYEFDELTFTSLTSFRQETSHILLDTDGRTVPNTFAGWFTRENTLIQEFNLARSGERLDWVAGLFLSDGYYYKKYRTANHLASRDNLAVGLFFDATFDLTGALSATIGARYSYENMEFDYQRPIASPATVAFTSSKSWEATSPRAVLRYEFDSDSNVYASYSEGFNAGLFNVDATGLTSPTQLAAQPLEPETLEAFEVGYKIQRPGWSFSTAAFNYDWTNIQVSRFDGVTTILQNAAAARIYGLEVEGTLDVTDHFDVSLGVAYNHGRYESFSNASVNLPVDPTNINSPNTVATSQDVSGQRILRTPDWTANLTLNHVWPSAVGEFTFTGSVNYTSEFPSATPRVSPLTGQQDHVQGDFALVTMSATWAPNDTWSIQVYGRNVLDEFYYMDRDANANGEYGVSGEPQTFGLKLNYAY